MSLEQTINPQKFDFTGSAKEWFGIWIVNLLLSIITIGIYSAWAKVRAKRYFYNSTHMEGRNFDDHATGGQILKGRLIVLYPWLLTRALMFNAGMSTYSNVRFRFVGTTTRAFVGFCCLLDPVPVDALHNGTNLGSHSEKVLDQQPPSWDGCL